MERKQCCNRIPHSERAFFFKVPHPALLPKPKQAYGLQLHSWIYVFGVPARRRKSTRSDSQPRDALSLLFSFPALQPFMPCREHAPPKQYLHGDSLYIDQPSRCASAVCPFFFFSPSTFLFCLYLRGLWTMTTVVRRQQTRGSPLRGLRSPRQHSWLYKHWPRSAPAYQRISQEVQKAFLLCCYCCCYSSGCQPASVYRWKQVHLLRLLPPPIQADRNRTQPLYIHTHNRATP